MDKRRNAPTMASSKAAQEEKKTVTGVKPVKNNSLDAEKTALAERVKQL